MKFALLVITSLVAAVYGQPAGLSYGYSSGLPLAVRTSGITRYSGLGGLSGLSGIGYSGLGSYGYGGYGIGGRTLALSSAAPAVSYVAGAAPAVSYVAGAAPAVSYVAAAAPALAAAPAISYVAQAAPAIAAVRAAPAISYVAAAAPAIQQQVTGPVAAAIESRRSVEVVDVPTTNEGAQPQTVVIGPNVQPINLEFQTQASPLAATQNHLPTAPAEPQQSSYEEQPDLLRQDIVKPVVQDVQETIVPFRRITQELKPVQESLHQILPRGEQRGFYQQQAVVRPQAVAVQAAPAVSYVAQAAPAIAAVRAAPAYAAVRAAPAVSYVAQAAPAIAAAPAVSYVAQAAPAIAAAPAVSYVAQAAPAIAAAPAVSYVAQAAPAGIAYGYGSGLSYGGSLGSSYALKPASSLGYTSYSAGAFPIRKKK